MQITKPLLNLQRAIKFLQLYCWKNLNPIQRKLKVTRTVALFTLLFNVALEYVRQETKIHPTTGISHYNGFYLHLAFAYDTNIVGYSTMGIRATFVDFGESTEGIALKVMKINQCVCSALESNSTQAG